MNTGIYRYKIRQRPKDTALHKLFLIIQALLFLLLCFPALSCAADSKVEGRVFNESGPLPGAMVYVYKEYQDIYAGEPFLISGPAAANGLYATELPPGEYYFIARGSKGGKAFFAYHGGNPITVAAKSLWITFMAQKAEQPRYSDGKPALQGIITYKGMPVKDAHVALYTLDARKFKGLGFLAEKGLGFMKAAEEDGTFDIPVVPNTYVVIARKTEGGNQIRPLMKGDLFCYAQANPIEVMPEKTVKIELSCYPKADRFSFVNTPEIKTNDYLTLNEAVKDTEYGIKGKIADSRGNPVPGIYVIAYRTGDSSTPTREAENIAQSDAAGNYFISLNKPGNYGLIIRQSLGDAPKSNDITGIYNKDPWQGISFEPGNLIENVNIIVNDSDRKIFE